MAYKAWFTFKYDPPATNGLAFATSEEASGYADNLLMRWYVPTGYEVRENDQLPTHRWVPESGLATIEAPPGAEHFPPTRVQL